MSESIPQSLKVFVASKEMNLPKVNVLKYIHIPSNDWFCFAMNESVVLGDFNLPHRSIVQEFFSSQGIAVSVQELQEKGYTNAGLLKQNNEMCVLVGNSGGLYALDGDQQIDMMRLNPEKKLELDEKTIKFLSPIYPDKKFHSLEDVVIR
jgi:hypothetical protein